MILREPPATAEELREIRQTATDLANEGFAGWGNDVVLSLLAELDRLAYCLWRGGSDDLITDEPATTDGHRHLVVNGSSGCACGDAAAWFPPPAEDWTLPPVELE